MEKPPNTAAPGTLLKASRTTMSRLRSRNTTKGFANEIQPVHDGLKAAQSKALDTDDHVIDMRGPVFCVHFDSQDLITEVEITAFKEVGKNRKDKRYTALFTMSLTKVKRLTALDFYDWFKDVGDHLAGLPKTRAEYAKPLADLKTQWQKPLVNLAKAEADDATAQAALDTAKDDWGGSYIALHGTLQNKFPKKAAFVESFFVKFGKKKAAAKKKSNGNTPPATDKKGQKKAKAKSASAKKAEAPETA